MKKNYLSLESMLILLLNALFILVFSHFLRATTSENPGSDDDDKYNKGVTVSPSHLNFNVDVGEIKTKTIKVTNYTGSVQKFRVKYNDFDIGKYGKSSFMEPGTSEFSMSKMINLSPTFIELPPGTSEVVSVTVKVSAGPNARKAAWGVVLIEQVEEKKVLDPGNATGETIAFGITPTFAFGIWVYQNPPNVDNMSVDIKSFSYEIKDDGKKLLMLSVENEGDGISFAKAYVEMTNLNTGDQVSLGGKSYTILPGYKRVFIFDLPDDLPKGNYSAVGVMDYNSDEEIVAAELELTIE